MQTVYIIKDGSIVEIAYKELVSRSVELTTTPQGIAPTFHIREGDEGTYEGWTLGHQGTFPKCLRVFDSLAEADKWLFDCAVIDFENDIDAPIVFYSRPAAEKWQREND